MTTKVAKSDSEPKKKKLIRIRIAPALLKRHPYKPSIGSGALYFSLAGPQSLEIDGLRVRHQVSTFVTCREELCEMPRKYLHDGADAYLSRDSKDYVDFEKFRLLMATGDSSQKADQKAGLFSAKRVLNILEEAAGWEKSIITSVVHEQVPGALCWLFTADKKWTKSPQMISLAGLILRIGFKGYGFTATTLPEVVTEFAKIANQERDSDNRYLMACYKHVVPLMTNIDAIFSGDPKQYYPKTSDAWRGRGGVYTFFSDRSGNDGLDKRLKQYCTNSKKD